MAKPLALIDLYQQHYAPARLLTASSHTKFRFELEIKRLAEFLGRKPLTTDLQTNVVSALLAQMIEKKLAMETVAGTRKKLVALWRFAHQKRFVEEYPDVPPIPELRDPPVAWTEEELRRLLKACRECEGKIGGIPANLWWHSLHMVLLDTGARIGATLKVEWTDVNLERGTMLFAARNAKNKRGQIHVLRPETVEDLGSMREPARQLVWPWPTNHTTLYYRYEHILQKASLPLDHKCKFHKLRRTVATWFEAKGGNATELLGHASRKHTKDSYLDETQIERPTPANVLPTMSLPIKDRREWKNDVERLILKFANAQREIDLSGGKPSPRRCDDLARILSRDARLMDATSIGHLTAAAAAGLRSQWERCGLAAQTVRRRRSTFQRFLKWLIAEGYESVASCLDALQRPETFDGRKDGAE